MSATPARGSRYAWFVVTLLMLAHVLSFVDRQILNLMVGPIRHDLGISDTQMSLLMGFSFAVFYTVCGIPLARWADSHSRRGLIAVGVVFWSLATAACGLAQRYTHMLLARIGVGVGEATLSPSAFSLITDYFPREQRATAISVFGMGTYIGSGLAYLIGGVVIHYASTRGAVLLPLLGEIRPWQVVFLVLSGAGLVFSLLLLAVREPARAAARAAALPMKQVLSVLRGNARTLSCHHFGFAMLGLAGYGSAAWLPSYFIRVLHWTPAQVGIVYGSIIAVFGTLGILCGGRLADYWSQRGRSDASLRVGVLAALTAIPCVLGLLSLHSMAQIAVLLSLGVFLLSMPFGAAPAALQEIVPPAMRAQTSAIYLFVLNMVGLGLGPTAVALVTDYVFHDDLAIGYSLMLVCGLAEALGALLLWLGLDPYRESYARQRAAEAAA
jgi:MFS family permease